MCGFWVDLAIHRTLHTQEFMIALRSLHESHRGEGKLLDSRKPGQFWSSWTDSVVALLRSNTHPTLHMQKVFTPPQSTSMIASLRPERPLSCRIPFLSDAGEATKIRMSN